MATLKPYTGTLPKGVVMSGTVGSDAKAVQTFLNWYINAKLDTDGIAGPKTVAAIKKFQKNNGIVADGIFGAKTKAKAQEIVNSHKAKKKTVKIGHACINEKGTMSGGKPGDQTGKECCITNWYDAGWLYVFRIKDKAKRKKLAQFMTDTCNNNNIGYNIDKPNRYAAWDNAEKNGHNIKGINVKGDTTCSQAVSMCMRAIGISKTYAPRHCDIVTLTKVMTKNPDFNMYKSKNYISSSINLEVGDILLSGHHTAIVVKVK